MGQLYAYDHKKPGSDPQRLRMLIPYQAGSTALHLATRDSRFRCVKALFETCSGAALELLREAFPPYLATEIAALARDRPDQDASDSDGDTPYNLCSEEGIR